MLVLLRIACKPVKKSLFHFGNQSPPLTVLPSLPPVVFFSPGINFSRPVCLKCWSALGSSRELIKASVTGLLSQSLWCSRFGVGSKMGNSNKFPGNADSWGPSVRSTVPRNTRHWLAAHSLFSFATPPATTWTQLHHHWHPHVEFTGHFVSSWDPCDIAHPTMSLFLIWLPRQHSPYHLPLPPPFPLALSEMLLLRYFSGSSSTHSRFHSFWEHCPCLLLFSIYILPETPLPCLKLLLACQ